MVTPDFRPRGPPAIFDPEVLAITTLVTIAFVVVAQLRIPWVLIPLGLFVLFIAPGYAAVSLLFGERTLPSLAANLALIVGFSVVFNVLLGVVLLYFGIGPLVPIVGLAAAWLGAAATIVRMSHHGAPSSGQGTQRFRSFFELPGFSRGQRAGAYALFVGILLTFGAIGYLSTLQPGAAPDLSLGLVGPDGTTSTLPGSGTVNSSLTVIIEVGNNATSQSLVLSANSSLVGENATNWTVVPWTLPLQLAPNVTSSEVLSLTGGEIDRVDVSFEFGLGGDYALSFSLTAAASHVAVRTSAITVHIT